ncbi:hypothetical protein, partial [Cephaloticoccus capnophilus]|uniref:hypothetical protein n=1 Tax=Cephaloticoccus capnophilus TaxID=1548208 RepID=UPI0018D413DC
IDDSDVNINSCHYLGGDCYLHSLNMYSGNHVGIQAPYRLTIGEGGIGVYASAPAAYISGSGVLTSSESFLNIWLWVTGGMIDPLRINSVIADNGTNKVGLRISGTEHRNWVAAVLGGDKSNTFTGPVEVSGQYNVLSLAKTNGAIATRGDIFINNHAKLNTWGTRQIERNSTVRLRDAFFQFADHSDASFIKEECFHKLVAEGKSFLQFNWIGPLGKRFLYLDDLSIDSGAELVVSGWVEGTHFFLVRKTSSGLEDALKRIAFEGYIPGRTHLEHYNEDYWMISGTPEPATYGAGLMLAALGLVCYRRRQKQRSARLAAGAY